MPYRERRRKPTSVPPFQRGDFAMLADRLGVSGTHVLLVARGERVGSPRVVREIEKLRARREAQAGKETAA